VLEAKTDKKFKELETSIDKWIEELATWIHTNMGHGAAARAIDKTQVAPAFNNVKPERAEVLKTLSILRDNLGKFVENPAWDKP
jgi:2-iminoacetate synthase ThiH